MHGRAKVELVQMGDGRYKKKQGNDSAACFSMIGCPVCMMLLVRCVVPVNFV